VVAEWTAQLPTVLDRPSFIIPSGGNISKVINSILDRIKSAPDGEKHTTLNRMAYVIGGYVGGGYLSQPEAVNLIRATVDAMPTVKDRQSAYTTAEIAVNDGTRSPLSLDRVLTLEEI
jgi:hypothetical protein